MLLLISEFLGVSEVLGEIHRKWPEVKGFRSIWKLRLAVVKTPAAAQGVCDWIGQKCNAATPQYAQGFTKGVPLNYTQGDSLDESAMQQGCHHHLLQTLL
jgi:hypothetical protein